MTGEIPFEFRECTFIRNLFMETLRESEGLPSYTDAAACAERTPLLAPHHNHQPVPRYSITLPTSPSSTLSEAVLPSYADLEHDDAHDVVLRVGCVSLHLYPYGEEHCAKRRVLGGLQACVGSVAWGLCMSSLLDSHWAEGLHGGLSLVQLSLELGGPASVLLALLSICCMALGILVPTTLFYTVHGQRLRPYTCLCVQLGLLGVSLGVLVLLLLGLLGYYACVVWPPFMLPDPHPPALMGAAALTCALLALLPYFSVFPCRCVCFVPVVS